MAFKEARAAVEVLANTIRLLYQGVFASRELADFELTVSPGIEAVGRLLKGLKLGFMKEIELSAAIFHVFFMSFKSKKAVLRANSEALASNFRSSRTSSSSRPGSGPTSTTTPTPQGLGL